MNYKFGVYGDSIAAGYGSAGKSWFDELTNSQSALNLAQNGEKTINILRKIQNDKNHYQTLILAVGINDLLRDTNSPLNFDFTAILNHYQQLVEIASKKAEQVIIQAVLPVKEELFPHQDWLDLPQWAFNNNIEEFNFALCCLANKSNALYLDAYGKFGSVSSDELWIDAVHLNKKGQAFLAEIYKSQQALSSFDTFD